MNIKYLFLKSLHLLFFCCLFLKGKQHKRPKINHQNKINHQQNVFFFSVFAIEKMFSTQKKIVKGIEKITKGDRDLKPMCNSIYVFTFLPEYFFFGRKSLPPLVLM